MEHASIVIVDGGRRLPRADLLLNNREPGLYSRFSTTQLGGMAIRAALQRTDVPHEKVGHVVMGMAQHSHRDSIYAAQGMRWRGGLPHDVPALTVARICGSGAEAISVGAEIILAGLRHDTERPFTVVGGAESMQYPFALYDVRGKQLGESSLYDPSARLAMANTAEELARRYRISREEADAFALRSHVNARKARDAGWFDEEIEPVEVRRDGDAEPVVVRHDTHILEEPSAAAMARLPPAFEPGGIVTAGNASAVVDGAAAMVIGREEDVVREGMKPLARIAGLGVAGCAPEIMGWGPVPATERALKRAGIEGRHVDWVEINEAFAPQALACVRDFAAMGIDPDKVNPMGSAIALGHPLGATGSILTLTAAYALRRTGKRYGLVTMCIGGGQGIAVVLESLS